MRRSIITSTTSVLHPLPYIPVHIIQPPSIRTRLTHRLHTRSIFPIPRIILQSALIVPKRPPSWHPRPTRILPLRLSRQTIPPLASLHIQRINKRLHIFPRNFHRRIRRIRRNHTRPRRCLHHRLPLLLRHLIHTQPKPLADLHLMLRTFNFLAVLLLRTHQKHPWLDPHHLHRRTLRQRNRPRRRLLRRFISYKAEANVGTAGIGPSSARRQRSEAPGVVEVEGTAPDAAERVFIVAITPVGPTPVLHPLPHIPVHIMQPPRIRTLQTHLLSRRIIPIPRIMLQLVLVIPKRPGRLRPRSAGILPLRFGRQAIPPLACRLIQPSNKFLHIFPRYIHRWTRLMRLNTVLTNPRLRPIRHPHHRLPLPLRHLMRTQPKSLADLHLTRPIRCPHLKLKHPRLNPHHRHLRSPQQLKRFL